jgi:hypothetical protein
MNWVALLHECGTIIAGVGAVIAAISSLVNGKILRNGSPATKLGWAQRAKTLPTGAASKPRGASRISKKIRKRRDWYRAPDV